MSIFILIRRTHKLLQQAVHCCNYIHICMSDTKKNCCFWLSIRCSFPLVYHTSAVTPFQDVGSATPLRCVKAPLMTFSQQEKSLPLPCFWSSFRGSICMQNPNLLLPGKPKRWRSTGQRMERDAALLLWQPPECTGWILAVLVWGGKKKKKLKTYPCYIRRRKMKWGLIIGAAQ